ncbi:MAG: hypothetical protein ACWGMZ_08395 [Thermoguttaceae bacterium]
MKSFFGIFVTALLLLLLFSIQSAAAAADESPIKTQKIVLYPMPEPRPALKYKFLPPFIDLKPGNAALFYDRLPGESSDFFNNYKMWEKACDWAEAPLAELQKPENRSVIEGWKEKINQIKRASQCESCDWQTPIREYGVYTLLPDLQQTRQFARLLGPYARLQIADGKFDQAVETLQAGYALGRHAAEGPTIVQGLVGCAIVGMMSYQVHDFIQQPGAPNLYWALTYLPDPIIDLRPCYEGESDFLYLTLPELRDIDKKSMTPEQCRDILNQGIIKLGISGLLNQLNHEPASFLSTGLVLESYPRAKSFLIDRGWPAEKVESMPVCQVVLIAALRQYEEIHDEIFKNLSLPYPEAAKRIEKFESKLRKIVLASHVSRKGSPGQDRTGHPNTAHLRGPQAIWGNAQRQIARQTIGHYRSAHTGRSIKWDGIYLSSNRRYGNFGIAGASGKVVRRQLLAAI